MKQFLIEEIMKKTWFFRKRKRKKLQEMDVVSLIAIYHKKCC